MWMGDGYLEHAKNRQAQKIQNIGWYCLESFTLEELLYFTDIINVKYNINAKAILTNTGKGKNPRVKIMGHGLQRFINLIYPYIIPTFNYKTQLFYKTSKFHLTNLSSAEHIIKYYTDISNYEDIVRSL